MAPPLAREEPAGGPDLAAQHAASACLADLPLGVLAHLSAAHLRAHDVVVLRGVCRGLREATESLWSALCER